MATSSFGPALMAVSWVGCIFGTTFMLLRAYTCVYVTRRCKADFWAAIATYLFSLAGQILLTIGVADWGLGHHGANLTHKETTMSQLYQWMFGTSSIIAAALGKITVILFILQFESQTEHKRKYFLYFLAFGTVVINTVIIGLIWTQCSPTAKMWDISILGKCDGRPTEQKVSYFQGSKNSPVLINSPCSRLMAKTGFGAFTDLALAIYPIAVFWTLSMPRNVKVGLSVLFSFGIM
jgi:hypothetical protein